MIVDDQNLSTDVVLKSVNNEKITDKYTDFLLRRTPARSYRPFENENGVWEYPINDQSYNINVRMYSTLKYFCELLLRVFDKGEHSERIRKILNDDDNPVPIEDLRTLLFDTQAGLVLGRALELYLEYSGQLRPGFELYDAEKNGGLSKSQKTELVADLMKNLRKLSYPTNFEMARQVVAEWEKIYSKEQALPPDQRSYFYWRGLVYKGEIKNDSQEMVYFLKTRVVGGNIDEESEKKRFNEMFKK